MDHAANWKSGIEHAALSDVGLRRFNNQDSLAVLLAPSADKWRDRGHFFMVADGMGAHAAGELASKMACDATSLAYFKLLHESPPDALRRAIQEANAQIHARGEANLDFKGMGTTASVLLLMPEGALVGHVGDSRVYRVRGDMIEQLTFDHSLVWEVRAGGMLAETAVAGLPKNVITRSLGPNENVEVDLEGPYPLQPGDTFVLCSDGLSGQLEDEEIGAIVSCSAPADAARALVDLANLRGGPDNITVIVVRVNEVPQVESRARTQPRPDPANDRKRSIGWIAAGVLGLLTILLAVLAHWAAIVTGAAFVITTLILLVTRQGNSRASHAMGRYGKGPYRRINCVASMAFLTKLAEVAQQLEEAVQGKNWVIQWDQFRNLLASAKMAASRGDTRQAVCDYCSAISFMMRQLREQRVKRDLNDVAGFEGFP